MDEVKQGPKRLIAFGKSGKDVAEQSDAPRTIKILDVTGEETDVTFEIVGSMSKRYRKAAARQRDLWAKARKQPTGDDLDRQARELTASCVVSWNGVVDPTDQSAVPCTVENVAQLLDEMPWVREQLDGEIRDHAAFFTKSSKA
jgi:hypothetical protein